MSTAVKFIVAVLGGALLAVYLVKLREFHPQHAFIVGFAGAGLVYWTLRAVDNLKNL